MGCCQSSPHESEVVFDKHSDSSIGKCVPIIHVASDSEGKVAPTPSFGTGNKKFEFEIKERDSVNIN
jgi:hypothetical protein